MLKTETESGPFLETFPYHPTGLDLWEEATRLIQLLPAQTKRELIDLWQSAPRQLHITGDLAILERYSMGVIEAVVERAQAAQKRTLNR